MIRRVAVGSMCLALASLPATPGRADNVSGGSLVCLTQYALCSSAACTVNDKDPKKMDCTCEIPGIGLNVANSSCQDRASKLMSTFSLYDIQAKGFQAMECPSTSTNWAFCLDAHCTDNGDGTATCSCETITPTSKGASPTYWTLGGGCGDSACQQIWSGATLTEFISGYSALWSFYPDVPKLRYCE